MKRFVSIFILTFLLVGFAFPHIENVKVSAKDSILVSSKGMITGVEKGKRECGLVDLGARKDESLEDEDDGFSLSDLSPGKLIEGSIRWFFNTVANFFLDQAEKSAGCDPGSAEDEGNSEEEEEEEEGVGLGLFNQTRVFTEFVNVTHIPPLMYLTGIVQKISLVLMVVFILVHSFGLLTGKSSGTGDTLKFFIKFGFVMLAVYAAPYLLQDILNVNNKLTHVISKQTIPLSPDFESMGGEPNHISVGSAFISSFIIFLKSATNSGAVGGVVMILITIVILFAVFTPIIRIVIWWYTRLFKIFAYTVISPFMLMTLASPTTETTGFTFIRNFVKTALEQLFLVLGMAVVAAFLSEVPRLVSEMGLGYIGVGLALYAGISFVAQLPEMASSMIDGRVDARTAGSLRGGALGALGAATAGVSAVRGVGRGVTKGRQAWNRRVAKREGTNMGRLLQEQEKRERISKTYTKKFGSQANELRLKEGMEEKGFSTRLERGRYERGEW